MKKILLLSLAILSMGSVFGYSITVKNTSNEKMTCTLPTSSSSNYNAQSRSGEITTKNTTKTASKKTSITFNPNLPQQLREVSRLSCYNKQNYNYIYNPSPNAPITWDGTKLKQTPQ